MCRTCLFFISSRRRHTRWPRDWSSDVCSSDLLLTGGREESDRLAAEHGGAYVAATVLQADDPWADAVHDIEAFGTVTSIITYSDTEEAVAFAAQIGRASSWRKDVITYWDIHSGTTIHIITNHT